MAEWVLLNPGPANTSLSVKQALVTPDLCHREPEFFDNTPFTPAVQVLHAMRQALIELEQEGLVARIARYGESARVLRKGMMALGFEVLVPAGARSSLLTTFRLLPGLGYDGLHDAMKRRGYIIYAGQGDIRTYAFRVSNMGTLTPADMKGLSARSRRRSRSWAR